MFFYNFASLKVSTELYQLFQTSYQCILDVVVVDVRPEGTAL